MNLICKTNSLVLEYSILFPWVSEASSSAPPYRVGEGDVSSSSLPDARWLSLGSHSSFCRIDLFTLTLIEVYLIALSFLR